MSNKSSSTDTFVVENCILSYPHLFALDSNGKYSTALLVPEAAAADIYNMAQQLAASHFVNGEMNLPNFRWPVMRAADKQSQTTGAFIYRDDPRLAPLGLVNANASADYPPQVVDANRQPIMDRGQIYAGCIVAAGLRLFTYNNSGNIGIGAGLAAVMKTGDGEALGGGTVNADSLFAGVQAQPAAPAGTPMPGGAPAPQQPAAGPFGQPTAPPAQGMPAAPFAGQQQQVEQPAPTPPSFLGGS